MDAVLSVILRIKPDILLLQGFDYDYDLLALTALRNRLSDQGHRFAHLFANAPNNGVSTGLDVDGDGRFGDPRDAQNYGFFAGQGGMALLSRYPIDQSAIQDFSAYLWKDTPNALVLETSDGPVVSAEVLNILRLSSTAHWQIPVQIGDTTVHLLAFHASPPVFDGPEDRNGKRNHDEIRFWQYVMDAKIGAPLPPGFVVIGDANQDPHDAEGRKVAIRELLADPRLQDPKPRRTGRAYQDADQQGDPTLDTVHWPEQGIGHLRVSYVLPSAPLKVLGSGVYWPDGTTDQSQIAARASRHRLVWVDLMVD